MNLEQAEWRKATASGDNGQCVEVATNLPDVVAVRDSKHPNGSALVFTHQEWRAFLHGATHGEFNI
ncbi:DUF397 domain-containing protein [Nonomuraea sp. NPDC000554]|uniref:DUF397 domain-containing protein n=1 Tax=Nonomuraea sp. NPDC000554 TaxID=3154259 RepID=UPI003327E49E